MKFQIGDRVRKINGYTFEGVVVSSYEVEEGVRYDVQVDAKAAILDINEMSMAYSFTQEMTLQLIRHASNCNGMIHIFSEQQLEKI